MTRQHRYRQEALEGIPGAEAHDYSPQDMELAQPEQGQLALDGSVLGPLFDQPEKQGQETGEQVSQQPSTCGPENDQPSRKASRVPNHRPENQ